MPLMKPHSLRTPTALVVALLLLALPATALAAESGSPSTGSGWVGQEGAGGGAGGSSSEAEQGSSLGSGGSAPAPEPEPQPVESSPPPAPAPEPIVPEASPEAPTQAPVATPEETGPAVVEAPVAPPVAEQPDPRSELAGGTAPVGSAVLGASAASPLPLAVSPDFSESNDSGGLDLYSPLVSLAIVLGFVLAGLAGRFALQRWRRRQRFHREAAEWQTAVRRLEPEQPKLKVLPGTGDAANGRPAAPAGTPPAKVG